MDDFPMPDFSDMSTIAPQSPSASPMDWTSMFPPLDYDLDMDGKVSLSEWLIAMKATRDKSEAACKTSLKSIEMDLVS